MAEMKAVELVNLDEGEYSNSEKKITLKWKFKWFKSREFAKLRQGFVPVDYSEYLKDEIERQKEVASRNITPVSSSLAPKSVSPEEIEGHIGVFSANKIYWSRGNWHCELCGTKGDKFFMLKHPAICKNAAKKDSKEIHRK
jgi:hypothetical protein